MHICSIHKKLEIVSGDLGDYGQLSAYHYRDGRLAAVKRVFSLRANGAPGTAQARPAGVIVYAMPNPRVELRNVATGDIFSGLDRQTELSLINHNVRLISRVIIEPRFRGIWRGIFRSFSASDLVTHAPSGTQGPLTASRTRSRAQARSALV